MIRILVGHEFQYFLDRYQIIYLELVLNFTLMGIGLVVERSNSSNIVNYCFQ